MDEDLKDTIHQYLHGFCGSYGYHSRLPSQDMVREKLNAVESKDRLDFLLESVTIGMNDKEEYEEEEEPEQSPTAIHLAAIMGHFKLLDVMLECLNSKQLLKVLNDEHLLLMASWNRKCGSLEIIINHLIKCEADKALKTLLQTGDRGGILHEAVDWYQEPFGYDTARDQHVVGTVALTVKSLSRIGEGGKINDEHLFEMLNLRDSRESTALHLALELELKKSVVMLINTIIQLKDIEPLMGQNEDGNTIFHLLTYEPDTDAFKRLLSHSSISSSDKVTSLLLYQNGSGQTVLHCIVSNGNSEALLFLLKDLSNEQKLLVLSVKDNENLTPVELAEERIASSKEDASSEEEVPRSLTEVYEILQKHETEAMESNKAKPLKDALDKR